MNKTLAASGVALAAFLGWQAWAIKDFSVRDTRPPSWDEAVQLEIALDYRTLIREHRWKDAFLLPAKPGMPPFPPLYHLAAMFAYDLSPENPAGAALWLNWVYLAILCVSMFAIAWELDLGSKAWAASILFCAAPIVIAQSHVRLLDLAVTAWAAAAYWAYLKSDGFFRWPASLGFGLIIAIGMMHKWSFFSYVLPLFVCAIAALPYPETRIQPLAAAAVALLGFGPWYAAHAPMLVPRLFQASSDFGVPIWEQGAFAFYFLQLPIHLGAPLFAFAFVGLFFPLRSRRVSDAKLMHGWFLTSYLFWAIVPNRQIRFLLPGLGGLGLLACGPWPTELIAALTAFQVFTAANFSQGWLPTWALGPGAKVVLFPTGLPAREDWAIQQILKTAQDLNPAGIPFSNVTLVANQERFNGPNFTWTAKWLGLNGIRMRGVNQRICEFSRFVVIKTGDLGPANVTEGLGPAARVIEDQNGWFNRAYEAVGRWPLPDKTTAFLFQLRPLARQPFDHAAWRFADYTAGPFSAKDLRIDLGHWIPADSSYDKTSASTPKAKLRGLEVSKLSVELDGLELIPAGPQPQIHPWEDVRFLKMRTLHVRSLEITSDALKKFLEARALGLQIDELRLEGDVAARATFKEVPVEASLAVRLDPVAHRLIFTLSRARVRGFSIPLFLLGNLRTVTVALDPNPETPFVIDVPKISIANGKLSVP